MKAFGQLAMGAPFAFPQFVQQRWLPAVQAKLFEQVMRAPIVHPADLGD
jgi:hypothetical protein